MNKRIFIGAVLIGILTGTLFLNVPQSVEKLSQSKTISPDSVKVQPISSKPNDAPAHSRPVHDAPTYPKTSKAPESRPIRMLFFGDMMLGRHVRTLIDRNGADSIFAKIREGNTYFDGYYDLVIANLEGPIVSNPIYHETGTTFGFAPDTAKIIKENKIGIVGIANNHTLDRGQKGFMETKKYLKEAGVEFFGHPVFPETEDILIKEIRGKKFAFIGLHDATRRLDEKQAAVLIGQYDKKVDAVIIYIHWGTEYVKNPNDRQKSLAHLFIDSGADLIIGHHPHWIQTRENYKGVEIFYSLGNFIFDQYWSDPTQHGLAVAVEWPNGQAPAIFDEMPLSLYKSMPTWE